MPGDAMKTLLAELAQDKARARARVLARLRSFYPPCPRWDLPDPLGRHVPNCDTGGPKDCVAKARELAPRGARWEDP